MKLFIIIPTYNRRDHLCRLLKQIENQSVTGADISIVAVVDGSTDGTRETLVRDFPRVHIINGTGDWWWTRSVNAGCKYAVTQGADTVLLMNDDTEIDEHYLQSLVEKSLEKPNAIIGSLNISKQKPHKIYFSGVKKITWWNARSVRYHPQFSPHQKTMTGLHSSVILMGRGMLVPVSVFDTIGFFDETSFPQYKADLDFVLTAHENKIETYVSWDSVVYAYLDLTGKGATYSAQGFGTFLKSFFEKNTYTNLIHSFRYYRKHCPLYLLPLSYSVDKLRLIYSYWKKRYAK